MLQPVSRVVDLLDPALNRISNMSLDEARRRVLDGDPAGVRTIDGSFALVAAQGVTVRLARSLDRPMRYFLAKRHEGPALYVADRIDTLHRALESDGLSNQFHPSYTRMVPAHYVVEIALVGCPDPDPIYTRFFTPKHERLAGDARRDRPPVCRRGGTRNREVAAADRRRLVADRSRSAWRFPAASTAARSSSSPTTR